MKKAKEVKKCTRVECPYCDETFKVDGNEIEIENGFYWTSGGCCGEDLHEIMKDPDNAFSSIEKALSDIEMNLCDGDDFDIYDENEILVAEGIVKNTAVLKSKKATK